jgi:hypothetical protein
MILPGVAVFAPSADTAARSAPAFAFRSADPDLVRRVLIETGVVREPSGPSLAGYVSAWGEAIARWISDFFSARPGLAEGIVSAMELVAIGVVATAAVLLIAVVVRRASRRKTAAPSTPASWSRVPEPVPAAAIDRAAWRSELEARLSRGDVTGALEALWWWLAASLGMDVAVDPSWTTRELLGKARRPELLGASATLDVLMYGRGAPSERDVRTCLSRFEEILP